MAAKCFYAKIMKQSKNLEGKIYYSATGGSTLTVYEILQLIFLKDHGLQKRLSGVISNISLSLFALHFCCSSD